jgi:transglutaminase-like putative cysteine protease
MRYRIIHTTEYSYSEPASLSQNELFLQPRETPTQRVLSSTITIDPQPQYYQERLDYFGNNARVFMVQHPHTRLRVTADSVVETQATAPVEAALTRPWEEIVEKLAQHHHPAELVAYQFIFPSPMTSVSADVQAFAAQSFPPGQPVLLCAKELMHRIFSEFSYDKKATGVDTPVSQVMAHRKGVCQDFAHLMISCLRSLGLAARYISGYLETKPPPGKPKLVGADASHAWLALFIPDIGWVDLDPTNDIIPGENHITLVWGRDYGDVTPVKGVVMGGGKHSLSVMVDVSPAGSDDAGQP